MAKEKKKEEEIGFDFGIGGLFKGIENLVNLAAKVSAKGESADGGKETGDEFSSEGEIDLSHLKKGMKGVFGFSLKTAAGGKPIVEPFGNIKKTPKGPKVEEEREPITDVFPEKEEIVVMAEMPGINEEGISLDLKGDILEIRAVSKDRKYYKEVLLPAKVKPETLESSYKNGILEIKIRKG